MTRPAGDPSPEIEDMQGREPADHLEHPAVAVWVDGAVKVRHLPAVDAASRVFALVVADGAQPIAKHELTRGAAIVSVYSGNATIGFDRSSVDGETAGRFAAGTVLDLTMRGEIFAKAFGGAAVVSVITEQWTD